jgi:hypothetical protein
MSDTLGSLRAEILSWLRGDLATIDDVLLLNAAINDSIEDIWMTMMPVQLARFMGLDSPVTFTLAAGAERVQLVTIADPTVVPVLGQFAGGALAQHTILVGYTYVTESGSETQMSPTAQLVVAINNLGQVTAPGPLAGAFGWNCYVSVSGTAGLMALQNQQPLPFNALFQEPPAGWQDYSLAQQQPPIPQVASSATPAGSPPPSENSTGDNISYITHMEIRTSDTLLRSWNQYGIDSEIMRRYGRTMSSASEYQTYVWDLINGNRIEIRPSAGITFTPRYFYVAKPRRLRYDQAAVPYTQIAGVHEFLVNKTLARAKLAIDEYLSSEGFGKEADKGKGSIIRALTQESWAKEMRVQPHLY